MASEGERFGLNWKFPKLPPHTPVYDSVSPLELFGLHLGLDEYFRPVPKDRLTRAGRALKRQEEDDG